MTAFLKARVGLRRDIVYSLCFLLLLTTVAYLPSLRNDFTNWDDDRYVTENPKIKVLSWERVLQIFTSFQWGGVYKPLTELSFALEYRFFGLNPCIFHTTNLLLHLVNCALVFWLFLVITRSIGVSLTVALLFGVHPLHVESVAWVSGRKDVLYACPFLGSLISYLYYLKKREVKFYYGSLFLFFGSLLAKPQGILLPFLILSCDYLQGRKITWKTLLEKAPFFLLAAVFLLVVFFGRPHSFRPDTPSLAALVTKLLNAGYGMSFYLVKLLLPVRLSCCYPHPLKIGGGMKFLYLYSPFLTTAVAIGVVFSARYTRKLIFAALFFFFNIALVLQVIPVYMGLTADRYTYISSIGLFYIGGEILLWLYARKIRNSILLKILFSALLLLSAVFFSALTWERCKVWADSRVLWRDVLSKYTNAPVAHNNLGVVSFSLGETDEAVWHYREALRLKPDYADAYNNLGLARADQGKDEEAIRMYRRALSFKRDFARAHNNLGLVLSRQGKVKEAADHYCAALRINPGFAEARANLEAAIEENGKQ